MMENVKTKSNSYMYTFCHIQTHTHIYIYVHVYMHRSLYAFAIILAVASCLDFCKHAHFDNTAVLAVAIASCLDFCNHILIIQQLTRTKCSSIECIISSNIHTIEVCGSYPLITKSSKSGRKTDQNIIEVLDEYICIPKFVCLN